MPTNQHPTQLQIVLQGTGESSAWAEIAIRGGELTVSAALAELLLQRYPTLPLHACKSGGATQTSDTFGRHLVGALLPHAAEHVAIELLVAQYPGESFAGNTSWISREDQTMRVRLSLPHSGSSEPSAHALEEAIAQLNQLLALSAGQTGQKTLS